MVILVVDAYILLHLCGVDLLTHIFFALRLIELAVDEEYLGTLILYDNIVTGSAIKLIGACLIIQHER